MARVGLVAASLAIVLSIVGTAAGIPQQDAAVRPAPDEIEALVRDVLETYTTDARVPERNLFEKSRLIPVRSDLPKARLRLGAGALPRHERYEFRLVSLAEAQAEADRTQQPFLFIALDRPMIDGNTATIWIDPDLMLPSKSNLIKMCCCSGFGHFRRVDDRWTFVKFELTGCI